MALRRLRRAAELASKVSSVKPALNLAPKVFDNALPSLLLLRNVGAHLEDYAVGKERNSHVQRGAIQVGSFDGLNYEWLGESLNIEVAHDAAGKFFGAVSAAGRTVS